MTITSAHINTNIFASLFHTSMIEMQHIDNQQVAPPPTTHHPHTSIFQPFNTRPNLILDHRSKIAKFTDKIRFACHLLM